MESRLELLVVSGGALGQVVDRLDGFGRVVVFGSGFEEAFPRLLLELHELAEGIGAGSAGADGVGALAEELPLGEKFVLHEGGPSRLVFLGGGFG